VPAPAGEVVLRGGRRVPVPRVRHVGALGEPARAAARASAPAAGGGVVVSAAHAASHGGGGE